MSQRIDIGKVDPQAYKHIIALNNHVQETATDPLLNELIKIRASQINGCAFCINMHTHDARAKGETEQRIYALNAWRDATYFTEKERAVLALTEAVTLVSTERVPDDVYAAAAAVLTPEELANAILAIAVINVWNRLSISTGLQAR